MNTAILQSMLMRGAWAIQKIEGEILNEKAIISHYKGTGMHKDCFSFRYKLLEKMRRELAALVKIQTEIKAELKENVKLLREFLDYDFCK